MSPERKEPVRVAVLGTGAISQIVYLPILAERGDVEIRAVADIDSHKAQTLAGRFGIPRVADDEAIFADPEIEAVVVCTPNHLHERQTIQALESGKHVLVERPVAHTAGGVRQIEAAAKAARRSVVPGLSHRYRPDVSALSAFVSGGELGRIFAARGAWLNRRVHVQKATWRQRQAEAGGGALMDLGVPTLDLCLWLLGYPRLGRVRALLARGDYEVEDHAVVMVQTENGAALTVEVGWSYFASDDFHATRVMGTEGTGQLSPLQVYKQLGGRPIDVTPRQPVPRGGENPYTNAYRRQIDHFLRVVAGESEAPFPREQARLMALIAAAYRSAAEGREVEVEPTE
jgi:predicted dehydrogenase